MYCDPALASSLLEANSRQRRKKIQIHIVSAGLRFIAWDFFILWPSGGQWG